MTKVDDFFISSNKIDNITDRDYQKTDVLINTVDSVARTTYKTLYVIDHFRKSFLYVSNNPLFLCGNTADEVKEMGYHFYIKNVPEEEHGLLKEMNRARFEFLFKVPKDERTDYTISCDFHILNNKRKTIINHKIIPILLTDDGKIWLSVCVVSLSSHNKPGNIEMWKARQTVFWEYSLEEHVWRENSGMALNEREKDILSLSAQGFTMNEIADELFLTEATIKYYKSGLFEKLGVKNIVEALNFVSNHRLI
jgi:DNA-binding CsgD family transcriptional regulator